MLLNPENNHRKTSMDFFKRAEVFRLKCGHHDKYLVAHQDEQTIKQSSNSESPRARWAVEPVEGKSNLIRLRSCQTWKYLAITDEGFLLGMTGNKVVQRLRLDSTVEWEPIRDGPYVKLKTHAGTFLRGNHGLPPWRNSVTHDPLDHWTGTENMFLWIVDIVKLRESVPLYAGVSTTAVSNEMNDRMSISSSGSSPDYNSDSQKAESFSKLKSMLAALEDELNSTEGRESIWEAEDI